MPVRISEIAFNANDVKKLSAFWCAVLDYEVTYEEDGDYVEISKKGHEPTIGFAAVPEKKSGKNRLHIDLRPADGDQAGEVERILALGATRVDVGQGEVSWVVLADPEGNEFCVLGSA